MQDHKQTFHVGDESSNLSGDATEITEENRKEQTEDSPKSTQCRPSSAPEWAERFWSKVVRRGKSQCWRWKAGKGRKGCGLFHLGGRTIAAPRAAWWLANGREPRADLVVMHSCDNPACCNPAHLSEGTHKQNSADMFAKGRNSPQKRARNGNAKLTEKDVAEIKELRRRGVRVAFIATDFGVCAQHVNDILKGERWAS